MTGDEIVAQVRVNYGDADNNYLSDAEIKTWLNQAVQDLYTILPDTDIRDATQEATISLTSGRGDLPSTWDRLISVYSTNGELVLVPSHVTQAANNLGSYFVPDVEVYSIDGNEISVQPLTVASVTAQYTQEPAEITVFTTEITDIPRRYHGVLTDMTTALAYASEEDAEQYALYQQRAISTIGTTRIGQGAAS